MNLPFVALFHPIVTCARQHAVCAMWAFRALCALALLRRLAWPRRPDLSLLLQTLLFVGGVGALSLCDPTQETRTAFGQPCASEGVASLLRGSACAVEEGSFWGAFRRRLGLGLGLGLGLALTLTLTLTSSTFLIWS